MSLPFSTKEIHHSSVAYLFLIVNSYSLSVHWGSEELWLPTADTVLVANSFVTHICVIIFSLIAKDQPQLQRFRSQVLLLVSIFLLFTGSQSPRLCHQHVKSRIQSYIHRSYLEISDLNQKIQLHHR